MDLLFSPASVERHFQHLNKHQLEGCPEMQRRTGWQNLQYALQHFIGWVYIFRRRVSFPPVCILESR